MKRMAVHLRPFVLSAPSAATKYIRRNVYLATAGLVLPTTIIGSLPRPSWYTENLGRRSFREAMVDRSYREQYLDAASAYLRDQEVAGLDILTDGDCRFDAHVGGHNSFSFAPLSIDRVARAHT